MKLTNYLGLQQKEKRISWIILQLQNLVNLVVSGFMLNVNILEATVFSCKPFVTDFNVDQLSSYCDFQNKRAMCIYINVL